MGVLRNPRHERFCQLRTLGNEAIWAAYQQSGFKGQKRQAYKLNQRSDVQARMQELLTEEKEARIEQVIVTKDMVTQGVLENIESAKNGVKLYKGEVVKDDTGSIIRDVDHGAINSAWQMLGIDIGMFVRESKIRHLDDDSLDRLTLDELLQHTQRVLWETSDGQIDLNTDALRRLLEGSLEADEQDPDAESGALPALSEATGVSRAGGEEA